MNKTIILAVQELESRLYNGLINEQFFQKELDRFLEMDLDEKTKQFIRYHKDRDI